MAMNDFEKMCKRLNDSKQCGCCLCTAENEYICAYNAVKVYVGEDYYKLCKLKSEAMTSNWWDYAATLLAALSATLTVINAIYTVFTQDSNILTVKDVSANELYTVIIQSICKNELASVFSVFILIVAVILFLYCIHKISKFGFVNKWKGYIQVAIEQLEKEKFKGKSINDEQIF